MDKLTMWTTADSERVLQIRTRGGHGNGESQQSDNYTPSPGWNIMRGRIDDASTTVVSYDGS